MASGEKRAGDKENQLCMMIAWKHNITLNFSGDFRGFPLTFWGITTTSGSFTAFLSIDDDSMITSEASVSLPVLWGLEEISGFSGF